MFPERGASLAPTVWRTLVRMSPDELDQFAWKFGVYRSTITAMPHPADDLDGWRRRWAKALELADELTRLARA
jgi:hypothetical protein